MSVPLLTFPMMAAGGIDAKADIPANMKIYFLLLFSPIPPPLPLSILLLLFLFDTWGGFNLSSCWGLADWLAGGSQGPTWYALSMSACVCVYVCAYCLHHSFCRLGEGCASDKGCWLSLADPCGPFTSCQSRGPQRGALPSALPQPRLTQQGAR